MTAWKKLSTGLFSAALLASPIALSQASAEEAFIPLLTYRTGPYAPNGIPVANSMNDYFVLLNERDGGVEGVKLVWEECETKYDTKLGVECYEKLKSKNPLIVNPYSTGITYALIPKSTVDKIPILSMGYGRTDAGDGRVFPWVFTSPTSYWSQASSLVKYIASKEGGLDKLKGKKITLVYHNSPYGKEPISTLEALSKKHGYELQLLAVDHPGQEQKATWLQIRQSKPDWILMWGWGVMNQVAVKEAASIGFKMDHFIGGWWSGAEPDVKPAGPGAKGYIAATFHAPGAKFKVHQDLMKFVISKNKGMGKADEIGEVLYNRGLVNALFTTEAIRNAVKKYGKKITAENVREGMEMLDLTEARLDQLGFKGMMKPIKNSCADHESFGPVLVQQWDGKEWKIVSDWIDPMKDVIRPMIEESAAKFAKENNITPRDCK